MIYTFVIFIVGTLVGSFLNNYIFRLHRNEQVVRGRSHCDHCKHVLSWFELIPIISWIILKAKCKNCHKKLDIQYPLVEVSTGILFVFAWNFFVSTCVGQAAGVNSCSVVSWLTLIRNLVVVSYLIVIFVYDFRWQLILDKVTIPAMIVVLLLQALIVTSVHLFDSSNVFVGNIGIWQAMLNLLLAAVVGAGFFLFQFIISKGTWIGGGDIRLGGLMGLILGWPMVVWALMLAYVVGAVIAVLLILTKRRSWSSQIPFGTFLALACVIMLFWGNEVMVWYVNLIL